jgi:hypothetical protein
MSERDLRQGRSQLRTDIAKEVPMEKPREPNGVEPDFTEDDIQREQLGPRGVPDPAKMTPQREKKTPRYYVDSGHVT